MYGGGEKAILLILLIITVIAIAYVYSTWQVYKSGPFSSVRVDELDIVRSGAWKGGSGGSNNDGDGKGNDKRGGRLRIKNLVKNPRSRSEAEVIRYLESITGESFPTAYPKWLIWKGKHLELDGFNGKDLALEFSGPLHTKWAPANEQYVDYFERIVRDVVKRRLCKKHGVTLIVVDASLPPKHWRNYLLSRLFDAGRGQRPTVYIDEQTVDPYRNEQIEAEMGISNEYHVASKL